MAERSVRSPRPQLFHMTASMPSELRHQLRAKVCKGRFVNPKQNSTENSAGTARTIRSIAAMSGRVLFPDRCTPQQHGVSKLVMLKLPAAHSSRKLMSKIVVNSIILIIAHRARYDGRYQSEDGAHELLCGRISSMITKITIKLG